MLPRNCLPGNAHEQPVLKMHASFHMHWHLYIRETTEYFQLQASLPPSLPASLRNMTRVQTALLIAKHLHMMHQIEHRHVP